MPRPPRRLRFACDQSEQRRLPENILIHGAGDGDKLQAIQLHALADGPKQMIPFQEGVRPTAPVEFDGIWNAPVLNHHGVLPHAADGNPAVRAARAIM
jgi:hypothetical protein